MPCNLIISGTSFDVDEYLSKTNWDGVDVSVHYKGQKRSKIIDSGIFEDSGFSLQISSADFDNFKK